MEQDTLHRAADTINVLLKAHISDEPERVDVDQAIAVRDDIREMAREQGVNHSFEVGDFALDETEPTPSPEANTVEIVELIDARADEYVIEEEDATVAELNDIYCRDDDPVVVGVYPNMSSDKRWHFPESRLRPV